MKVSVSEKQLFREKEKHAEKLQATSVILFLP